MFRFKAVRKSATESWNWYSFTIKDCPALLWDDVFFLPGKNTSPTLMYNTIVRGHPTLDIFEGDIASDKNTNEVLGIVIYNNGFYIQNLESSDKNIVDLRHIKLCRGNSESINILNKSIRTPILYNYMGLEFGITDVVHTVGPIMHLIIKSKPHSVNLKYVTDLLYQDNSTLKRYYEGHLYNGDFITVDTVHLINIL